MRTDPQADWKNYCENELSLLVPILSKHYIVLDMVQPHIVGERYLQQAVTTTSGKKLILIGYKDQSKVVIKATRDKAGKKEIQGERLCRSILNKIDFAGEVFNTPREILFLSQNDFLVTVTEFIEQECAFLDRSTEQQFAIALHAFKGQESAHATTWNHRAYVEHVFGIRTLNTYLHSFSSFKGNISTSSYANPNIIENIDKAEKVLRENAITIDQYTGFLTHTDFVPHNIRVRDNKIYLLDYSSLTFGNKYEGWARFLNFMALYNPQVEQALVSYVAQNRASEESTSLRMMRIYRLGEIIWYYIQSIDKSTGNLLKLNTARITFWNTVLTYILNGQIVPDTVRIQYTEQRDALRSDDEKLRQKGLH